MLCGTPGLASKLHVTLKAAAASTYVGSHFKTDTFAPAEGSPVVIPEDDYFPSPTFWKLPLLGRVSDAGRLRDGAACSAAGVRKPPRKETALKGT